MRELMIPFDVRRPVVQILCAAVASCSMLSACPVRAQGVTQSQSVAADPHIPPTAVQPRSPSQPYTLHVNAQAVLLDVVVTDKHGQIAKNLTKDDFQVSEDRVPQVIQSFEYSVSEHPPARLAIDSTAQLDKLAPSAPVNIIVLDEINTKFEDEAFARYSLKKFLNSQGDTLLQPTMLVAVNLYHFMVLRDYTTSKEEILTALSHHLAAYPWQLKSGGWMDEQVNMALGSLMEVAQATSGHAGHKSMIWIGRGLPSINSSLLDPEAADALKTTVAICTNALRDARVALYTLDPAGLTVDQPPLDSQGFSEDDPLGGQVDFNMMAKATGGQAFHGHNDVAKLITTSVRDGSEFYALSYVPTNQNTTSTSFRRIRVVMKDRDLHVMTREGYYSLLPATPPPAKNGDGTLSHRLVFDLGTAGQSLMVYDGLPLNVVRDPASKDRFLVHMMAADIPWQRSDPQNLTADVSMLIESFDKKGNLLDRNARMATVQVPATAAGAPAKPTVTLLETISAQPPAARLRFVVRVNSNGKVGADNMFLVDRRTISDPITGLKLGKKY